MGYHSQLAICVLLLGITGVTADTMETWKLVAIIVPSVVGGLTLLSCLFYCCCWTKGSGSNMGGCMGCDNECMGCRCNGCDAGCNGCCNGCDDCCGCCYSHPRQQVTQVYSSQQGPIQVQPAQKYRSAPLPAIGYNQPDPTYVRSMPGPAYGDNGVYGVSRQTAQVYGSRPQGVGYGSGPQGVGYGGSSGPVYGGDYGGGVYGGRSGW